MSKAPGKAPEKDHQQDTAQDDTPPANGRGNARARDPIGSLLQSTGLWRASSIGGDHSTDDYSQDRVFKGSDRSHPQARGTGYPQLDSELPGADWPTAGVTEFLHPGFGIGELRLLAPALARLSREQSRWLFFVRPPYLPYPPALDQAGIDLTRVIISQPRAHRDYLWVLEKSLASNSCSAVITWPGKINTRQIRRLQIAAKEGNCWGILFRDERESAQASPAELRIRLRPAPGIRDNSRLNVRILKRRGRWESGDIQVCLEDRLQRPMPDFSELLVNPPEARRRQTMETASQSNPIQSPAHAYQ